MAVLLRMERGQDRTVVGEGQRSLGQRVEVDGRGLDLPRRQEGADLGRDEDGAGSQNHTGERDHDDESEE